jgi:hypothetical protein
VLYPLTRTRQDPAAATGEERSGAQWAPRRPSGKLRLERIFFLRSTTSSRLRHTRSNPEEYVAPEPIEAPFLTRVGSTIRSASVCPQATNKRRQ